MDRLFLLRSTGAFTTSIAGVVAPSMFGVHYVTTQTIDDQVENVVLAGGNYDDRWRAIQSRFKSGYSAPKTESLIKLKGDITTNSSQDLPLKKWCLSVYKTIYKSAFVSKNAELRDDVKNFCIYKIMDKIGHEKLLKTKGIKDPDKEKWNQKLELLKTHDNKQHGNIHKRLDELKNKIATGPEDQNAWKSLRDWCRAIYEVAYKEKFVKELKLTNRYCKAEDK